MRLRRRRFLHDRSFAVRWENSGSPRNAGIRIYVTADSPRSRVAAITHLAFE
jgi:hypothetical protein